MIHTLLMNRRAMITSPEDLMKGLFFGLIIGLIIAFLMAKGIIPFGGDLLCSIPSSQ
jgi:predicted ABC-type sugar transport system permease subunit